MEPSISPVRLSLLARLRTKVAKAFEWTDDFTTRAALACTSWLVWPCVYSVAVAAGLWSFWHPAELAAIDTNKLAQPLRVNAVYWLVAAFAAITAVYLGAAVVVRIRSGAWQVTRTIALLNRWLIVLLALPIVAYLRLPGIEKESAKLTLLLTTLAAAACGAFVYQWGARRDARLDDPAGSEEVSRPHPLRRAGRWLAAAWVLGLWAGYGWFFSRLSITNHHALNTRTTDLGYYDNIFYQSIHGRPLGCSWVKGGTHVSAHFDPFLVLLSPLYLIHPRTELILALQAGWLGAGVVPAYLLGKRLLDSRPAGVVLATMFALYPALHGANMYEFHSLTLISPLVLWLLYFFETGSFKRYWVVLFLLLLCREDVPLLMCVVGVYQILTRRPGAARTGLTTIAVSFSYFVIVKAIFMRSSGILNAGKDAYSYDYYYEAMNPGKLGAGGMVTSILTNPVFTLKTVLDEPKIFYMLLLFLPLGLLPLLAKPGRFMLLYGMAFTMLASRAPVFSISFQYSSVIFPIAFALVPIALRRIEDGRIAPVLGLQPRSLSRALLGAAFASSLLISWKFGGLTENQSFRGGFGKVTRTLSEEQRATYGWVNEQATSIPRSARVGATNKLGSHVSNRRHAYFWPAEQNVDYVFLDESELKANDLEKHNKLVAKSFVEVSRRGKMALYKRK